MRPPPGRRSPGAAISRATAANGLQTADEANTESTSAARQNAAGHDEPQLFGAVIRHGAYGRTTAFFMPEDADGAVRRDRALADVEATADGQDRAVIDQGIRAMVERGRPFSINDLRPLLPVVRKSLVGARFLAAAKAGTIVRVGYVPSTEPSDHARPVALWRPA